MTNLQVGDYIHHRANSTLWRVTAINPDGTLQVEFYAGNLHSPRRMKVIKRPEEYRKAEDEMPVIDKRVRTCLICDRKHYGRGYCQHHYYKWRRGEL